MVTPYYNKTTQLGLIRHYNYIADRVKKPVIIYNVPSRTGLACTPETYKELSRHPMINGVKEASGNFTSILNTRYLCGDEFNIWSGNDDQIVPILSLGGFGVISVLANILPGETHEIVKLFLDGKVKESCEMQIRYSDLIDKLFIEVNPIPVKTALNLMGFEAGPLRMPLCDMLPKNLEALKISMRNAGIHF
jgi:4-hydroxy-tetrahydrodipicolinate synthase